MSFCNIGTRFLRLKKRTKFNWKTNVARCCPNVLTTLTRTPSGFIVYLMRLHDVPTSRLKKKACKSKALTSYLSMAALSTDHTSHTGASHFLDSARSRWSSEVTSAASDSLQCTTTPWLFTRNRSTGMSSNKDMQNRQTAVCIRT